MRLCRYERDGHVKVGVYSEEYVLPLERLADAANVAISSSPDGSLLPFLTGGKERESIRQIQEAFLELDREKLAVPLAEVSLLVPVPSPSKLLLLAGNYSKHIEEGGGKAEERANTFPYVFMKPPLTTLTHPGDPIRIPAVSPDHVDWELELGVIIGKRCKGVTEADALNYVAGYTIVNDISDRKFQTEPRPSHPRERWLLRLAARQMARHVLPDGPLRFSRRRTARPANAQIDSPRQRRSQTGFLDGGDGVSRGGDRRIRFQLCDFGTGRHHLHRHAVRRGFRQGEIPESGRPNRSRDRTHRHPQKPG